jgi:predicted transcriptional regulator
MLEEQIKRVMRERNISAEYIYKPLKINLINFYKAIKTSNFNNQTLLKILHFLELQLIVKLEKYEDTKKDSL